MYGLEGRAVLADQAVKPPDGPSEAEIAAAEEPDQSDDDQVKGDDVVQQPGHDQNENSGEQRYQGSQTEGDIHGGVLSVWKAMVSGFFDRAPGNVAMRWIVFTPKKRPALYGPERNDVAGEMTMSMSDDRQRQCAACASWMSTQGVAKCHWEWCF